MSTNHDLVAKKQYLQKIKTPPPDRHHVHVDGHAWQLQEYWRVGKAEKAIGPLGIAARL
ncbi:hypothetical protein LguiB_027379 [Lonicera macranthoides]